MAPRRGLRGPSEGEVPELHIDLEGAMGAFSLKALGEKACRGEVGRVAQGRMPGGISYGYRRVTKLRADGEPERGLREIDEAQAAVVRRIFREFLAGRSPCAIALSLNQEGVPSPSGREWRADAINGNPRAWQRHLARRTPCRRHRLQPAALRT